MVVPLEKVLGWRWGEYTEGCPGGVGTRGLALAGQRAALGVLSWRTGSSGKAPALKRGMKPSTRLRRNVRHVYSRVLSSTSWKSRARLHKKKNRGSREQDVLIFQNLS